MIGQERQVYGKGQFFLHEKIGHKNHSTEKTSYLKKIVTRDVQGVEG